jgi:hypothetical protein
MRHSFVSLLSASRVPLEHIPRLVGHSGTPVAEAVYRQQLRPVLDAGCYHDERDLPDQRCGIVTQIVAQRVADLA